MAWRTRGSLVLALATAGCTRLNPAYDPGEGDASAGGTAGGSAGASEASTSAAQTGQAPTGGASSGQLEGVVAMLVNDDGQVVLPLDVTLSRILDDLGIEVMVVDDEGDLEALAEVSDLVVISETASSGAVGNRLSGVERPVICMESVIWPDMGLASAFQPVDEHTAYIEAPGHPLAAGLEGPVSLVDLTPSSWLGTGVPGDGAQVIAVDSAGTPVVFAYPADAPLTHGGGAPDVRVAMGVNVDGGGGMESTGNLGPDGEVMFGAAVRWALQ